MPKNSPNLENFKLLAADVALGASIKAAAAERSIPIQTAYRVSRLEAFRKIVAELRAEALSAAVGKLTASATKAIAVVEELLESKDDRIRLNAAKAIIASLAPLSEFGELRARVDMLEQQKKQQPKIKRA